MTQALLPWLSTLWNQLAANIENSQVPHALVVCGKSGVGKQWLAQRFAQSLLCTQRDKSGLGCGRCTGCRLFEAGTHPDWLCVEPKEPGKPITIDAVRALSHRLALAPQYGGYRVVRLAPADHLNAAAANGLLKTLEEPADQTVILLLTERPSSLPATIISRCQRLSISVPEKSLALAWLQQQGMTEHAEVLLALACGAPFEALELAGRNATALRASLFQAWLNVGRQVSDPVTVAESWSEYPCELVLAWVTGWVIDMIRILQADTPEELYNVDWFGSLQAEAQKLQLKELYCLLDRLFASIRVLDSQLNRQLLLEAILIEWRQMRRTAMEAVH